MTCAIGHHGHATGPGCFASEASQAPRECEAVGGIELAMASQSKKTLRLFTFLEEGGEGYPELSSQ